MEKINTSVNWSNWFQRYRESKTLILFLVAQGFFLDYMLLTTIVPIIPEFLYNIEHPTKPFMKDNTDNVTTDGNSTDTLIIDEEIQIEQQRIYLQQETIQIGAMFASKYFVQLFTTPVVGYLITRIGYNNFMLGGFIILFMSTIIFAFGQTYFLFFFARSIQGLGASCLSVSGLSLLADTYQNQKERGTAIGVALDGLALGNLLGPLFGGIMYELIGKTEPFLILTTIAFGSICLQLLVRKPDSKNTEILPTSLKSLLSDSQIILSSVTLMIANIGITLLEAMLPIWMMETMNARRWQQGTIFLPFGICYLMSTHFLGSRDLTMKRWLTSMLAISATAISYLFVPLTQNFYELILPMIALGFSIGAVDCSMLPELAHLVDIRHAAGYASAYVIGDLALCLGDAFAPILAGIFVNYIGFLWTLYIYAVICFIYILYIYCFKKQSNEGELLFLLRSTKLSKQKTKTEIPKNKIFLDL